jgi:hypothetical protein
MSDDGSRYELLGVAYRPILGQALPSPYGPRHFPVMRTPVRSRPSWSTGMFDTVTLVVAITLSVLSVLLLATALFG